MKQILIALLALISATLACTQQSQTVPQPPARQSTQTSLSATGLQMGVAGLIPRNFPNPSNADWLDFYGNLPETGPLLGVYTNWTDAPETAGRIPQVIRDVFDLSERYNFIPIIALSIFRDYPDGSSKTTLDLNDPVLKAQFKQVAVAIAKTFQPPYLVLGIEINRLADQNPNSYEAFVSLYTETYQAIKESSPETQVFTIFQYERLRGGIYFDGDKQEDSHWDLFEQFKDHLDLAAFTTYPFLLYDSPADLPADYYAEISQHTKQPVAFTEMGWPSRPLSIAPDSPFGGSQDEQNAFVRRFFELTQNMYLKLALWSFPHDVGPDFNPAFTSISLRKNNGQAKPLLAVWQEYLP
jgi:hypothetical protein